MNAKKHILSNQVDLGFHDIKASLAKRSDAFPVMLLPIRLETRFVKDTKSTAVRVDQNHELLLDYFHQIRQIIHWVELYKVNHASSTQAQLQNQINTISRSLERLPTMISEMKSLEKADKLMLTKATKELTKAFSDAKFPSTSKNQLDSLFKKLDEALSKIAAKKTTAKHASDLYNKVHKLAELMQAIYVDQSITSLELDKVLEEIDHILVAIPTMINKGEIETNPDKVKKIASEISHIKRMHKHSPITLQSYRTGYPGRQNLATKEDELRKSISTLKSKIDKEYAPYMNLLISLRTQRAMEVIYQMEVGYFNLKTDNSSKYADIKAWNKTQTTVNKHVKSILDDLNHPLEGTEQEIKRLKVVYQRFSNEIISFNKTGEQLLKEANKPAPAPPQEKPKEREKPVITIPERRPPTIRTPTIPVPQPRPLPTGPLPRPLGTVPTTRASVLSATQPAVRLAATTKVTPAIKTETVARAVPNPVVINERIRIPEVMVLREKVSLGTNNQFINEFLALKSQLDILSSLGISSKSIRDGAKNAYTNEQEIRQLTSSLNTRINQKSEVVDWMLGKVQNLEKSIRVRAGNTGILPQKTLDAIRGSFQTLVSRYKQGVANLSENKENVAVEETLTLLQSIDLSIQNQYTDQKNNRTTFSKDYINQIRYLVESEVTYELWIRFFPDDIAVDDHDERLTEDEIEQGKNYFRNAYLDTDDTDKSRLAAWRALAASVGVRRAAYIIQAIQPSNLTVSDSIINPLAKLIEIFQKEFAPFASHYKFFFSVPLSTISELSNWVKRTSSSLNSLTPCLETKPSLLACIDILQRLEKNLLETRPEWRSMKPEVLSIIRVLIGSVQKSLSVFLQYKTANASKLERPFSREFNFKNVEKKSQSWDRAGICTTMPDRMIVGLKNGDVYEYIKVGNKIPESIQLSLDPSDESDENFSHDSHGNLRVPKKLAWMFDFEEAIKIGMGMKISISEEFYDTGFDRVIATGVRDESPSEGQKRINELFESHHFTDGGLELLEVDTPTNNAEDEKSPYSELDDDVDYAFDALVKEKNSSEIEKSYTSNNELEIADGQYFKDALGLHKEFAVHIPRAMKRDISEGKAMNRALYNATIKYFMKTMASSWFNHNDEIRTLEFLQNHLSAVGAIPSFRIGPQPYGVLPITVYDNFITGEKASSKSSFESYLRSLSKLANVIRGDFEKVLFQPEEKKELKVRDINDRKYDDDPQKYFLEILGLEPNTKDYIYRHGTNLMGRIKEPPIKDGNEDSVITVNWDRINGKYSPNSLNNLINDFLDKVGHTSVHAQLASIRGSRVYKARYNFANHVLGPKVQDPELGQDHLATIVGAQEGYNYISWLKDNRNNITHINVGDLPKVAIGSEEKAQTTLLLAMIRGGLVYDKSPGVVKALNILETLPINKLERLLADHLDLCSHRIDAWLEGLSAWRLRQMRATQKTGTYVGAYGILENLRPQKETHKSENVPDGLRPKEGYPVYKIEDNQGFIHAPSLQHATTAAVLRAGFNAMQEREGSDKNILSINLSSSRVRKALFLLQGVSQGQSAGALLGYQFERALHEKYEFHDGNETPADSTEEEKPRDHLEMDRYIYRLRRKFPTYGDRPVGSEISTETNESIRANNVVDGEALLKYFEDHVKVDPDKTFTEVMASGDWKTLKIEHIPSGLKDSLPDINVDDSEQALRNKQKMLAIIKEIDEMADTFDALGDLITSESVYQLVRGNHQRAAGVMNSFAEGQIPRDPEIIKSLRNGNLVINRGLFLIPEQGNAALWGLPASPKSAAEPRLNSYFANQIGAPNKIQFAVIHQGTTHYLDILNIGLQPIDLVFLLGRDADSKWEEMEFRVIKSLENAGFSIEGDFHFMLTEHLEEDAHDVFAMIPFFEALFDLFNSCRAADARDLRRAEHPDNFDVEGAGLDIMQFTNRIDEIIIAFKTLRDELDAFDLQKTEYSASEVDTGYELFKKLASFGFANYFPNPLQTKAVFLSEQLGKLLEAKSRIEIKAIEINKLNGEIGRETEQAKILNLANEIVSAVFGNGMKILPKVFIPDQAFWQSSMQADPDENLLEYAGLEGLEKWQHDSGLVRKNIAKLENLRMLQEVLSKPETSILPAQVPLSGQETPSPHWMGTEYPEAYKPEGDYLCFMLYGGENLIGKSSLTGLVVDEWAELIPEKIQTTGVAVHYNQPDARAPQSILMAVPPELKGSLDIEQILLTVEEALNLAKLRTFEPDDLDHSSFSQVLPASSALAYGHAEFLRATEDDQIPEQQSLGWYIDYSITNNQ
ncbi:hypothetical protein [Mongoliibacter ruber]|uniref:Uncharacterized protein n=1 Tax=Mongoliibacter ruber TaxID=1750599 RepID=A0A2T0WW74_9BACT|nr:hypothetical protein [Mongoliibacter ruber]PRY90941.1 hypothetical protein CLW00_101617 [Mongoliibacter ruber]